MHINAGVDGLVGAFVLGKRVGLGKEPMAPHSLTMTLVGASLLWFGWFGFNAGSALEANGSAALAFMNTYLATPCAVLSWIAGEWIVKGKPSMLGAASGAVAGLVAITPAAGNVGIPGAFAIGLRHFRRAHDRNFQRPLTWRPRFHSRLGQRHERLPRHLEAIHHQLEAVCLVFAWTAVVAFIAFYFMKRLVGLRVPEEEEREGLDITSHGEPAYDL